MFVGIEIVVNGSVAGQGNLFFAVGETTLQQNTLIQLDSGDEFQIRYKTSNAVATTLNLTANCFLRNQAQSNLLGYNNTIDFSQFFSGEYTQKELLLNFVKMFHLILH